jgi:hypothetical protein
MDRRSTLIGIHKKKTKGAAGSAETLYVGISRPASRAADVVAFAEAGSACLKIFQKKFAHSATTGGATEKSCPTRVCGPHSCLNGVRRPAALYRTN